MIEEEEEEEEECCGVFGSVVECWGVCCCMCWLVTSTPKSHLNSKKVTSTLKSQKKNPFFFGPFCYKNVEKMFYQPQKVTLSPQKVKKVKKSKFFLFFTYCARKSHIDTYIFGFWPFTPIYK